MKYLRLFEELQGPKIDKEEIKNVGLNRFDTKEKYLFPIIDNDGNLHQRKGYIVNDRRYGKLAQVLVDSEWDYSKPDTEKEKHEYIAGIDPNGYIIGRNWDNDNRLLNNQNIAVKYNGNYWIRNKNIDDYTGNVPEYSDLIDNAPTGWVNVKIDKEVVKKVKRFSSRLSRKKGNVGLREKLRKLEDPTSIKGYYKSSDFTETMQQKISSLMLLKYLQEIKEKFNPTSGGFLFESFIGGLLNGQVPDDNRQTDVIGEDGRTTYQIKLYDWLADSANIPILPKSYGQKNTTIDGETKITMNTKLAWEKYIKSDINYKNAFCDFYIVGLKQNNKIVIHVLNSKLTNTTSEVSLKKHLINSGISLSSLRNSNSGVELNLVDLDKKIEKISQELKQSLNSIWTNLSEIEYNIEAITTGQTKDNKFISDGDFDNLFFDSSIRLDSVKDEIFNLKDIMTKK